MSDEAAVVQCDDGVEMKRSVRWAVELEEVFERTASTASESSDDLYGGSVMDAIGGGGASPAVTPLATNNSNTAQSSTAMDKAREGDNGVGRDSEDSVSGGGWNTLGGTNERSSNASSRSSTGSSRGSDASSVDGSTDGDGAGAAAAAGVRGRRSAPSSLFVLCSQYYVHVITTDKLRHYDDDDIRCSFVLRPKKVPKALFYLMSLFTTLLLVTNLAMLAIDVGWIWPSQRSPPPDGGPIPSHCVSLIHDTSQIAGGLGNARFALTILATVTNTAMVVLAMFVVLRSVSFLDYIQYVLFVLSQNIKLTSATVMAICALSGRQILYPRQDFGTLSFVTYLLLIIVSVAAMCITDVVALRGRRSEVNHLLYSQLVVCFSSARVYARVYIDCGSNGGYLSIGEKLFSGLLSGGCSVILFDMLAAAFLHLKEYQWWAPSSFRFNNRRQSRNDFLQDPVVEQDGVSAVLLMSSYFCDIVTITDGDEASSRVRAPPETTRGDMAIYRRHPNMDLRLRAPAPRYQLSSRLFWVWVVCASLATILTTCVQVTFLLVAKDGYNEDKSCLETDLFNLARKNGSTSGRLVPVFLYPTYVFLWLAGLITVVIHKRTLGKYTVVGQFWLLHLRHSARACTFTVLTCIACVVALGVAPEYSELCTHSLVSVLVGTAHIPIVDLVYLRAERRLVWPTRITSAAVILGFTRSVFISKITCIPDNLTTRLLIGTIHTLLVMTLIEINIAVLINHCRPTRWHAPTYRFRRTFVAGNVLVRDHPGGRTAAAVARDSKLQYLRMRKRANKQRSSSAMSGMEQRGSVGSDDGEELPAWNQRNSSVIATSTNGERSGSGAGGQSQAAPAVMDFGTGDPLDSLGEMGFAMDTTVSSGGGIGSDPLDDIDLEL